MKKVSKAGIYIFLITVFQIFSYEYFKEIELSGDLPYKEFYITEDIYSNSGNLDDIRIINRAGKEVPYVIEKEEAREEKKEKIVTKAKILEKITKNDKSEFIVKFESSNPMEDIVGNSLEITTDKNFYSWYELLGSGNGTNWEYITSGEIYKTPEKESLVINFSEKRYSYYKIITSPNREISFYEGILKLRNSETGEVKTRTVNLNYEIKTEGKSTVLKIRSGFLPLKNIVLDVDEEFRRSYSLRVKDMDEKEGIIFKVGDKMDLIIEAENIPKSDEIILEIKNGDNDPLKIKSIKGSYTPDKIVFKAEKGESYRITFGDASLEKPEYDIESFSSMISERDEVIPGSLNKVEEKQGQKPKDYSFLYNIFIGVTAVILIVFMSKKISGK